MWRVLHPGGRLAVSVWASPKPTNGFGLLYGCIKAHGDLNVPLPHGPDFFQFSEHEKLTTALQITGFRDVSVRTLEQIWELTEALGMVTGVLEGAVRARGLLLAQTESARNAISDAVKSGMERYLSSNGVYRVPMPALVGAGKK